MAEAMSELETSNLTLAQARARAEEAQSLVRQALVPLLPTVAAGASYTRNNAEAKLSMGALLDAIEAGLSKAVPRPVAIDHSGAPADAVIQPLQAWTAQASVRVPLFAAHAYADVGAARAAARAAELSIRSVRHQLLGALQQSAVWAAAAEEIVGVSERALVVAHEHARSAERQVEAGIAPALARLQATTEVVRRESELVRAKSELDRSRLVLGVLLGRAEPVRVAPPSVQANAEPLDALAARAVQQRPELGVLAANLETAKRQEDSARWRLAPTLAASASGLVSDVAFVTGERSAWKLSVDLSWTLYDGGLRSAKGKQAQAQAQALQAALDAQTVEVRQQVLDARRDAAVAARRLDLAQRQAALARETAASAKRGFEAGLASSLDVLDANDREYQAELAVVDATARVAAASVALARATGSSWSL